MKKEFFIKIFLFLFLGVSFISCTSDEEESVDVYDFSPAIPGGSTSATPTIHDISHFEASSIGTSNVTLTWSNPSLYEGLDYDIYLYRVEGDIEEDEDFEFPDPSDSVSGAYLYYVFDDFEPLSDDDTAYFDSNDDNNVALREGDTYTYLAYIEKDGIWSKGVSLVVTIPTTAESVNLESADSFWPSYSSSGGAAPEEGTGTIYYNTLLTELSDISNAGGAISQSEDGLIIAHADTSNNRVVLYINTYAYTCYDEYEQGDTYFNVCIALYANAPYTPYAVLGQEDFSSTYSCGDASNTLGTDECLTSPRGVLFHGEKLYVTTGDNYVAIYDTTPRYGCYNYDNMLGSSTPSNCAYDRVIGKAGFDDDPSLYDFATYGNATLSCPSGMAMIDDSLYIADTCNHRIVRASNAASSSFNCTSSSFQTSSCVFTRVLGQPDLFSNERFQDEWDLGDFGYDEIADTLTGSGDLEYLKNHFSYPSRILQTDNGQLLIVSNENFSETGMFGDIELYSRILVFDESLLEGSFPNCSSVTFDSAGCDASYVLGQRDFDKLSIVSSGANYSDNNYALRRISDITVYGDYLIGIDYITNEVIVYTDISELSTNEIPDFRIVNPEGEWDSDNSRALPDLLGLTAITYIDYTGALYIVDGLGSSYYTIPFVDK